MNKILNRHTKNLTLFTSEKVTDFESLRNKYALRVHKGIAEQIIKHKHARPIYLYLEIKPLFASGVIFADQGKIPYKKIAEFVKEGVSTVRKKINVLKKLKLIRIDKEKNIILSSLNKLPAILKVEIATKKKYNLLNNGETQYTIKQLAIYENLKKQEHVLFRKIYGTELVEHCITNKIFDVRNSNGKLSDNIKRCEDRLSKNFLRRFKRSIRNNFDEYKKKYQKIYDVRVNQLEFGYPVINPNVTLSYRGIAKILNRSAISSGQYQSKKLFDRKYLTAFGSYTLISDKSPAIFESMEGLRQDIFSYQYNTRKNLSGRKRLYFRNNTNQIETLTNATFF
jgi:hypothetical protein